MVQAHRWLIERTFSWWGGWRQLGKNHVYQVEFSVVMIYVTMSHLMTRWLARLDSFPNRS